jgi:hypothetical protein
MFQSSAQRLRTWMSRFEDVLADPSEDAHDHPDDLLTHPHRRPLRWERTRRAGAVPARPGHCISPVRATWDVDEREPAAH